MGNDSDKETNLNCNWKYMCAITRKDFKHNFLKSVIIRLDLQGVLESDIKKVLTHVKTFAEENGLTERCETDISAETANKSGCRKVYSFANNDKGTVLAVSSSFISVTVNTACYTPFESYREIVPHVFKIYKENISSLTVVRAGLRKINECLIPDKHSIHRFFNSAFVNYYDNPDSYGIVNTIQSRHIDVFMSGKYCVNLITGIMKGVYEDKTMFCVRVDIDAFSRSREDISLLLENVQEQNSLNDLVFNVYLSSLTKDFIKMLTSDDEFDNSLIIGVERND